MAAIKNKTVGFAQRLQTAKSASWVCARYSAENKYIRVIEKYSCTGHTSLHNTHVITLQIQTSRPEAGHGLQHVAAPGFDKSAPDVYTAVLQSAPPVVAADMAGLNIGHCPGIFTLHHSMNAGHCATQSLRSTRRSSSRGFVLALGVTTEPSAV